MRLGAPIFESSTDPDAWIAAVQRRGYRAAYCPVKPDADRGHDPGLRPRG